MSSSRRPIASSRRSQILLRSYRFGEHDGLAAAMTVSAPDRGPPDRFLERARFSIVRKRSCAGDKILYAGQLSSHVMRDRRRCRILRKVRQSRLLLRLRDPGTRR